MLHTPVARLRIVGLLEGISYLVLLGIAMPLKYFADFPQAVKIVGSLHGALFVLFMLALAHVTFAKRWSIFKVAFGVLASLIPFGTFVLDARLKKEQ